VLHLVVVNPSRTFRRALLAIACFAVLGLAGTSGAGLPNRPVPHGFQPLSFTAISEQDFWLLGTVPCRGRSCTAIVRTTDGGRRFHAVNAPALPISPSVPELRFADHLDGFAFVRWSGRFFATHDGGASWKRLNLGRVLGFATGAGKVFVVTSGRLEYSPLSVDAWRSKPLPFSSDGSVLDLEARQAKLWLLGTRRGTIPSHDVLARSTDAGRTFVTSAGPCVPGLGGELAPTSADAVWAVCPTGMLAGAWRSTNGGVSFARLRTPQLVNSSQIAAASATTAVLDRGVTVRLLRTTDGGRSWKPPKTPGRGTDVIWVGFTDARVGAALVQTGFDKEAKTLITSLWRTTDGGATWSTVRIR
jgi:photosystem II stability/assembly factor-like uncharacterized protein